MQQLILSDASQTSINVIVRHVTAALRSWICDEQVIVHHRSMGTSCFLLHVASYRSYEAANTGLDSSTLLFAALKGAAVDKEVSRAVPPGWAGATRQLIQRNVPKDPGFSTSFCRRAWSCPHRWLWMQGKASHDCLNSTSAVYDA